MINFNEPNSFLNTLRKYFPINPIVEIPDEIFNTIDSEKVKNIFKNRSWIDVINYIDEGNKNGALEFAVFLFTPKVMSYYVPFYIYASTINDGWVFDDAFIRIFLIPTSLSDDVFLEFYEMFDDIQVEIIAKYLNFSYENKGYDDAKMALSYFWGVFLE